MKVIKEGKENIVICENCSTEYEFDADDINTISGNYYYVKCPVCGKYHFLERYFSHKLSEDSIGYHFKREIIAKLIHEYNSKHEEELNRYRKRNDDRCMIKYMNGEDAY